MWVCVFSCSTMSDSATLWTVACQAPLSMGFSRKRYWKGLPFPPPGNLSGPESNPALADGFFTTEQPGKSLWEDRSVFNYAKCQIPEDCVPSVSCHHPPKCSSDVTNASQGFRQTAELVLLTWSLGVILQGSGGLCWEWPCAIVLLRKISSDFQGAALTSGMQATPKTETALKY